MKNPTPKALLCYAHGRNGAWQGICVDYDIAVQGSSFEEVKNLLNEAIVTYIADALEEPARDQKRLLNRNAPFLVKVGLVCRFLIYVLFRNSDRDQQANFSIPCPA